MTWKSVFGHDYMLQFINFIFKRLSINGFGKLSAKVLILILLSSGIMTLLISAVQIADDFFREYSAVEMRMVNLRQLNQESVTTTLWFQDEAILDSLLERILYQPNIAHVYISDGNQVLYSKGSNPAYEHLIKEHIPLVYDGENIGVLTIVASLKEVYADLFHKIVFILVTQAVKTFIISLVIIFIIHTMITKHLLKISHYAQSLNIFNLDQPLYLDRKIQCQDEKKDGDELDKVVRTINDMRLTLLKDIEKQKEIENKIKSLNDELEKRVIERTDELAGANEELRQTITELKVVQKQLVESEKMASLSNLVAGVAHEINTPLGIATTAYSHLDEIATTFIETCQTGKLTKAELKRFHNQLSECNHLIANNLKRAAKLVMSFKQVSIDHASNEYRMINIREEIENVIASIYPSLRNKNIKIELSCPADLILQSYPGCIFQILSNLILNSEIHAFDSDQKGIITVEITEDADSYICTYQDDGKGMSSETTKNIFEPFYTTKRGAGGTGLGMHIVYNIVVGIFHGTIECHSKEGHGAQFLVTIPKHK